MCCGSCLRRRSDFCCEVYTPIPTGRNVCSISDASNVVAPAGQCSRVLVGAAGTEHFAPLGLALFYCERIPTNIASRWD